MCRRRILCTLWRCRVFWAPNGTRLSARCHFTGPKELSISRAQPPPTCPRNGCCPHQKQYAWGRLNHRYINSFYKTYLLSRFSDSGGQCCGSGSGIRCLFDLRIRDPGPDGKKSGSGIRNKHPELPNKYLGYKCFNSLLWIRIRDPDINIPDQQH
jgi:hypothetical protein